MAQADIPIQVTNLIHRKGLLQAAISVDTRGKFSSGRGQKRCTSPEYIIEGITQIQIIILFDKINIDGYQYEEEESEEEEYEEECYKFKFTFYLKVAKINKTAAYSDDQTNIVFSCLEYGVKNRPVPSENGLHEIFVFKKQNSYVTTFNITLNTQVIDTPGGSFAPLYDDTDLTDFELHGEGGSVPVHKAVLAACSPVLKRMLSGDWKETKSGQVNIPGTSKSTLENLKSYMYLREMPQTGFQQLLLLAAYYMMPGLERRCVEKLVTSMTPQNTLDLCEFAVKNKMDKLHLSILERIQAGTVKVADIRIANNMESVAN